MISVKQKRLLSELKKAKRQLNIQKYRTIKGQIFSGDLEGARRGMEKLQYLKEDA